MLKICVVSDGLPFDHGGAQFRAFRHTRDLHATEGVEATLIVWDRVKKQTKVDSLPAYVHPVKLRFQDRGGVRNLLQLIKFVLHLGELGARLGTLLFSLRHQFDVLHVINAATWFSLLIIPLAKALHKPVIVEMVLSGADDPLKLSKRDQHMERQLFPHRPLKYTFFLMADAYVSKSYALDEAYCQAGLPEAKLLRIPSGVDTEKFRPASPQEKLALRQKLGLDVEQIVILFVGILHERKGVHRLLAAFREIVPHHPRGQLLIVGPGRPSEAAYLQAIHRDVEDWGLSTKVVLVKRHVDNVDEYMKAADIFALPTRREGLSVAILEAMASGLAIVASDIPAIALSQIQHGIEGLLVPVEDITGLADSLAQLIENTALRARLGRAARQRVLREFTLETMYSRYLDLYERLSDKEPVHG